MSFYTYRQPPAVRGVSPLRQTLYPARIEEGFFDHFPDTSLDSRWTAVTGGSGTVTVAGSEVTSARPGSTDAAYFYLNRRIKTTDTGLWTFCSKVSVSAGFKRLVTIRDTTTPGTALAWDSDAAMKLRFDVTNTTGADYLGCQYIDSGATRKHWNANTQVWGTGNPPAISELRIGIDNYAEFGLELDGINRRFRMMAWTIQAPSTSYTFDQGGPRLMQLTDWVNWSDVASGQADMYLQCGTMFNTFAGGETLEYEWARYEDGPRREGWVNGRDGTASYDIRHVYTFGDVWIPQDRTTIAIPPSAPTAWDQDDTHRPFCVLDGSNYRVFFDADNGTTTAIGVATSTDPDAVLTKDGGNPIVSPPSGYDDLAFPYVLKDENEADSNKVWKMMTTGVETTTGDFHILYFTSPNYNGTWTYSGSPVLEEGIASSVDELGVTNPVPFWDEDAGQWVVFFAQKRPDPTTSQGIEDISWATGSALDNLTKSDTTLVTWQSDGQEVLTANLSGNTATVASETGFTKDSVIYISEDNVSNNYGISRIRAVSSGSLELYHELEGFTSGNSATIIQADRAHGMYFKHVEKVGIEYRFFGVIYRTHSHVSSYDAFAETSALWTHSGATPTGTTPVLEDLLYPNTATDYFGHERSHENIGPATLPLNIVTGTATPKGPLGLPLQGSLGGPL